MIDFTLAELLGLDGVEPLSAEDQADIQKHFAKPSLLESDAEFRERIVAAAGRAIATNVCGADLDEIGAAYGVKRIGAGETSPEARKA
jgi:hypothetical protein